MSSTPSSIRPSSSLSSQTASDSLIHKERLIPSVKLQNSSPRYHAEDEFSQTVCSSPLLKLTPLKGIIDKASLQGKTPTKTTTEGDFAELPTPLLRRNVKVGIVLAPSLIQSSINAWGETVEESKRFKLKHDIFSEVETPLRSFFLQRLTQNGSIYPSPSNTSNALSVISGSNYGERTLPEEETFANNGEKGCGWLCFRPKCLQSKQTAKWVLFWLCWAGAVQGMVVNGFVNVCITTIEKRYHLKSADTGIIAGAYDIASVLCSIPVSYFGSLAGASKPRWLGWGMVVMGIGSFVFSLPHFISPPYKDPTSRLDGTAEVFLCLTQTNSTPYCADKSEAWLSSFKHVFAIGQFLHGVGAAPLYTLGITFLDESVPVRMSSLYLGVFYAMAIVGPAFGYVLGGQLLNVYIDAPSVHSSQLGISSTSDQWLGAWWIGFILSGILAFIVSWIVMSFPAEIPGFKARAQQRVSEANASVSVNVQSFENIRDLPKASKFLASNLTFMLLSLAGATEGVLLTGFATFMPKFFESQFSLSASNAALLVGMIAVPAGGGGTLIGGWIIKHFHLKCGALLKLCACLSALCFVCCLSFVISCPDTNFAGVTVGYLNSTLPATPNLISTCNKNCACADVPYDPVCGIDRILYFSPCHAGCTSMSTVNGNKVFGNCECIAMTFSSGNSSKHHRMENASALLQKCPSACSLMTVFLIIFFVIMTITFIISLPAVSATLRCVPDTHRSLALGLQWIIIRILGTIPGPILFGIVIDGTCRLWQNTCNTIGACRSYNNLQMSRSMMAISLIFKSLTTIFFFLSWWFYIPPKIQDPSDGSSLDDTTITTTTTPSTCGSFTNMEPPSKYKTAVDNIGYSPSR